MNYTNTKIATGPGLKDADLRGHIRDEWLIDLLREVGYTDIGDIPIEHAYFDTDGAGPYDTREL